MIILRRCLNKKQTSPRDSSNNIITRPIISHNRIYPFCSFPGAHAKSLLLAQVTLYPKHEPSEQPQEIPQSYKSIHQDIFPRQYYTPNQLLQFNVIFIRLITQFLTFESHLDHFKPYMTHK